MGRGNCKGYASFSQRVFCLVSETRFLSLGATTQWMNTKMSRPIIPQAGKQTLNQLALGEEGS